VSLVVLDTDVASASFLGRLPNRLRVRLATSTPCITFVTLGELTKWTMVRSWGPQRTAALTRWRQRAVLLGFDSEVATMWGALQARAQLRGRPRPVNDTWIAACCLVERLPLATFNARGFADFADHEGLVLEDVS